MKLRAAATAVGDFLAGNKTYAVCITFFALVVYRDRGHYDARTLVDMGFDAVLAFLRMTTWQPGHLSGTESMKMPDGGTLILKPPPETK